MNYCCVRGDSENNPFYWGKEKLGEVVEECPHCRQVKDRDAAIKAALKIRHRRFKRFFYNTWDGVFIASPRFYELYHQYKMKGITFYPLEKVDLNYVCHFDNIAHFDLERAKLVTQTKSDGTTFSGVLDNGICPVCGKSLGHHYPWPYCMIPSDEAKLQPNTFYRSDIEFAENQKQHPLLWATEGIVEAFTKEGCRFFYENVEGNFGKGDCGKQ